MRKDQCIARKDSTQSSRNITTKWLDSWAHQFSVSLSGGACRCTVQEIRDEGQFQTWRSRACCTYQNAFSQKVSWEWSRTSSSKEQSTWNTNLWTPNLFPQGNASSTWCCLASIDLFSRAKSVNKVRFGVPNRREKGSPPNHARQPSISCKNQTTTTHATEERKKIWEYMRHEKKNEINRK